MTRRRACIALWPVFLLITGPVFAAPTPGYWQGIYRAGNEVNSLQPCPGNLVYWVGGNAPAVLALREYVLKHSQRPYQPVYVELFATLSAKQREGDAAGYDGLLLVDSVENISLHLPEACRSLPPEG